MNKTIKYKENIMFKKSDDNFFSMVDIIQKVIIFFILASLAGGIILICFVDFTAGILMATILPVLLIVLSLILYAMTYVAIDAKIARNKACGEDYSYLTDLLDLKKPQPEKPNPNQKYIDKIFEKSTEDCDSEQDVKFVEYGKKKDKTPKDNAPD